MLDCNAPLLEGILNALKQHMHAQDLHLWHCLAPRHGPFAARIASSHSGAQCCSGEEQRRSWPGHDVKLCACRATMAVSFALPGVQTAGVWPQGVRMTW